MIPINRYVEIFNQSIADYHVTDSIDTELKNPYPADTIEHILYTKNWIDTVQWHFEDIIREPLIKPENAIILKRKIDAYNQKRTDLVEQIEDFEYDVYSKVTLQDNFILNTETLGWAIDRLSILCLKIYHMNVETQRTEATQEHRAKCQSKLDILLQQQKDLSLAIVQLNENILAGRVKNLRYRQMKMYNDPSTNPVLYAKK